MVATQGTLFEPSYNHINKTYSVDKGVIDAFDKVTKRDNLIKSGVLSDLLRRLPLTTAEEEKLKTVFEKKTSKKKKTYSVEADALQNLEMFANQNGLNKSSIVEKLFILFLIEKGVRKP